jgi:Ca2+-binding EF-hand superfamily protein
MTPSTKLILATVLGATLLGTAAYAQSGPGPRAGEGPGLFGLFDDEGGERMGGHGPRWQMAEGGGHGWRHGHGEGRRGEGRMGERMFDRFDADEDGFISAAEATGPADRRFTAFDADKDGKVTKAEIEAEILKRQAERIDRMISRLDTDKDGAVSKEEAQAPFTKRFADADADKDGKVSKREARRAMMEWREERRGGFGPDRL